jgi:phosphoribosyl 1,2-cyclic phosphodiesterase
VLLECADSRLLIDAGFAPRALAERLERIGVAPESVEALVLTHEHADHVKGACAAARQWGWSVHATEGTVRACPGLADVDVRTFEPGATLTLGRFDVHTVPTPHDAAEPVAVVATSRVTGARVGVVYDLGYVTKAVRRAFADLDVLVLEANHDEAMLRAGPYPPSVRDRIAGTYGHLSNRAAAMMARECAGPSVSHLVLAHLSESCNDSVVALGAVAEAVRGTRFRGLLCTAAQDQVVGPFTPAAGRSRATQLSLF